MACQRHTVVREPIPLGMPLSQDFEAARDPSPVVPPQVSGRGDEGEADCLVVSNSGNWPPALQFTQQ